MTQTDVAIIGAGPYGLSISAHLRARGIDHVVLGRPLESWRAFMPEKMVLKSEPFACNLWDAGGDYTLETYRVHRGLAYQPCGAPLPLRDFLSYADWFQRNAAPDILQTYAHALRREASGGFSLDLDQGGTLRARSVVLASGHMPFRETPEALRHLPPELCIHSSDASDIQRFAGKDVTIVGLGQAALEHAALLLEAGARVRVIGRDARVTWNGLPRPAPTLRERIAAPEGGLGAGWRAYLFSEFPRLFRQLPDETRLRVVRNGWGPAGPPEAARARRRERDFHRSRDRGHGFPRRFRSAGLCGPRPSGERDAGRRVSRPFRRLRDQRPRPPRGRRHERGHLRSGHALHVWRETRRAAGRPSAGVAIPPSHRAKLVGADNARPD